MKVRLLMALEKPGARAQQLARQMLIYGRPLSLDEMIARVDAISRRRRSQNRRRHA